MIGNSTTASCSSMRLSFAISLLYTLLETRVVPLKKEREKVNSILIIHYCICGKSVSQDDTLC